MNDRLYQAVIAIADETTSTVFDVTEALSRSHIITNEEEEQIDIRAQTTGLE